MDSLAALFTLAEIYGAATGLAEGTVSDRVLHGGNRLRDLREGRGDIGIRRVKTAIQWFSDHWPATAIWPAHVERPRPTVAAAAPAAAPIPEPAN